MAFAVLPVSSNGQPVLDSNGVDKDTVEGVETACASFGDHGYSYCGQHWQRSKLPARFRLNITGTPTGITSSNVEQAARLGALVWDRASPISGTGPRGPACGDTRIMCIQSVGNVGVIDPSDGINTIVWAAMGTSNPPATAWVTAPSAGRITDVDIRLNSSLQWYWSNESLLTGVAAGAVAYFCVVCPQHFDVQSILTHELGHALGLGHPNPGSSATWPSDPADALDYNLVMYPRYYPNNATQRMLQWGDLLGLQVAMEDSASDP